MRLHLIALPHTQVSSDFNGCAYTAKILKFCKMMGTEHEIFLYAPEGPQVVGAKLFPCLKNNERIGIFGVDDPHRLPGWPSDNDAALFNVRAIELLRENLQPRDLILLSMGWTHKPIADAFPVHICCEPGVGYQGILTQFCAFESYAWMHYVYAKKDIADGRWFDTVVPNYFDPDEFPILNSGKGKYLLFLGRVVQRKGPQIAGDIAKRCGLPLVIAGAGAEQVSDDVVAPEVTIKDAIYIGPLNVEERAKWLTNAKALIVPTTYIEPFGGVAVEAMMCGTPVITTDWGAFSETVEAGVSGFRFRTLAEAEVAVEQLDQLKPERIRNYALRHYSLDAIRPRFNQWFMQLSTLWEKGWYN